ncbi:trimeric intracellular cation channel family protein [Shimia sp. SDUM112013]|uniref:trimeric intracellular cation channel family protein n=1 Tax=Shimia sp. SDUM112013 TaxID=3136160 RepID=UPI0032F04EEA
MNATIDPLAPIVLAISYFGDVVFAISGALTAMRYRMDIIGVVLIGVITGIGGGTMRDLLIGRTVFWVQDPTEIVLCIISATITFFFINDNILRRRGMIWGDALGLAAFGVVGCHIALAHDVSWIVAVLMGMITATGGGVIRDVVTNTQPMITSGQIYASCALLGAGIYAGLSFLTLPVGVAEVIAFSAALALRAVTIHYDVRMGPRGTFIEIGKYKSTGNGM